MYALGIEEGRAAEEEDGKGKEKPGPWQTGVKLHSSLTLRRY